MVDCYFSIFLCWRQLTNLEMEIRPYLSKWYEESVLHIHRVVQLVQGSISFLLHSVSIQASLYNIPSQPTTTVFSRYSNWVPRM